MTSLEGGHLAGLTHAAEAAAFYAPITPLVLDLRCRGLSLRAIARQLDADGVPTRNGCPWNPVQVNRILARATGGPRASGELFSGDVAPLFPPESLP